MFMCRFVFSSVSCRRFCLVAVFGLLSFRYPQVCRSVPSSGSAVAGLPLDYLFRPLFRPMSRPSSGAFPAFMGFIVTAFTRPSFRPKAGPFTKDRPQKFALIGI